MSNNETHQRSLDASDLLVRRAPLRMTTFDPETGVFSAVIATETPVRRGDFVEILSMKPSAVRLGRLQSKSAPLLDSHRSNSTKDQIGIVTSARIEARELIAEARLSPRDDVKPIAADLAAGTPPNVSIGYRVHASTETIGADGQVIVTRTDWEPFEMSFVPIPADPNTHVRKHEGTSMPDDNATATDIQPTGQVMTRIQALEAYEMTARHGLPANFARALIEDGTSMAEFRKIVLNERAKSAARTQISSRSGATSEGDDTFENPEFLSRAIEGALYARMSGKAPEGPAREFMGRSLLQIGEVILSSRGERVSWSNRSAIADKVLSRGYGGGGLSTSDLPTLLGTSGHRVLQDAYTAAQSPIKDFARRRDAVDFRPLMMAKVGEAPALKKVLEGGEVQHGGVNEAKESFRLNTFARIFGVSRQAIINDDLYAFSQVNQSWGRACANMESDELVALLTANSGAGVNLDDGNPIYTTARKNKATSGGAIGATTLDDARKAMRVYTGLDGKTLIGSNPKHMLVGPSKETEAQQFLATTLYPATPTNGNPFAGLINLHVEPRLAGNAWRLFADPSEVPSLVMANLTGFDGPMLDVQPGWSTLGVEFRCVLDFGCGVEDWRGSYLNPGN